MSMKVLRINGYPNGMLRKYMVQQQKEKDKEDEQTILSTAKILYIKGLSKEIRGSWEVTTLKLCSRPHKLWARS